MSQRTGSCRFKVEKLKEFKQTSEENCWDLETIIKCLRNIVAVKIKKTK